MDVHAATRKRFQEDGVTSVAGALSPSTLALVEQAYAWSLEHPGPGASPLLPGTPGRTYQDLANPIAFEPYRELVQSAEIRELVTAFLDKPDAWFMYEQVFLKEGDVPTGRTPWHQDLPYLPVEGPDLVVLWISLDPVPVDDALEFVTGSHQGPVYDGSRFDPSDPTAPLYGAPGYPRLPDIEAERDRWPIVSFGVEPGDVVVFHPAVLHGGGGTVAGARRRTLTLRFFGEDTRVVLRPGSTPAVPESSDRVHPLRAVCGRGAGAPFRDPGFPRIAPA